MHMSKFIDHVFKCETEFVKNNHVKINAKYEHLQSPDVIMSRNSNLVYFNFEVKTSFFHDAIADFLQSINYRFDKISKSPEKSEDYRGGTPYQIHIYPIAVFTRSLDFSKENMESFNRFIELRIEEFQSQKTIESGSIKFPKGPFSDRSTMFNKQVVGSKALEVDSGEPESTLSM